MQLERERFETLDLIRSLAALGVVVQHLGVIFVHQPALRSGQVGVDFFFMLSGFVIAHAYGRHLREGLSPKRFLVGSLVRLYPVYLVGVAGGLGLALLVAGLGSGPRESLGQIAASAGLALFFLPTPPGLAADGRLFPLNGPLWSLLFEMLAITVYAVLAPRLSRRGLAAVVLAALAAFGAAVAVYGRTNLGYSWDGALGGAPRALFAFFAGVLLQDLRADAGPAQGSGRRWLWALCGLALAAAAVRVLLAPVLYELVLIVAGLPLLIWIGSNLRLPERLKGPTRWMAATAYPLYVLHVPVLGALSRGLDRVFEAPVSDFLWVGVLCIPGLVLMSALVHRLYERPIRRRLLAGETAAKRLADERLARTASAA